MACCKCCCGGVDCAEGAQGKCCCGGSSGTCCSESQYCCSGVCQNAPCVDCQTFDSQPCYATCGESVGCSTDEQCEDASFVYGTPDPDETCLSYYSACCPVCFTELDEFGSPITTYCGTLP